MRDYLTERNLCRASVIGIFVTAMAVPRMMLAGVSLPLYIPAGLLSMILVAGAATAWGRYGGLHGLFPDRRRMIAGIMAAVALAIMTLPVAIRLDALRVELSAAGAIDHWIAQSPPTEPMAVAALVLWVAGFETIFFQAGTISYLARLFKDWRPALAGAVILRGMVSYAQMGRDLSVDGALWFQIGALIDATVAGTLYVAAGWPPAAVYAVVLAVRHLWTV